MEIRYCCASPFWDAQQFSGARGEGIVLSSCELCTNLVKPTHSGVMRWKIGFGSGLTRTRADAAGMIRALSAAHEIGRRYCAMTNFKHEQVTKHLE